MTPDPDDDVPGVSGHAHACAREDWRAHAACRGCDPLLFFPERGEPTREARRVCAGCPVVDECAAYAFTAGERFGIWGGLSERERRRHRTALRSTNEGETMIETPEDLLDALVAAGFILKLTADDDVIVAWDPDNGTPDEDLWEMADRYRGALAEAVVSREIDREIAAARAFDPGQPAPWGEPVASLDDLADPDDGA